jgi:phosphatidylserine/phosphatidylglycerophosphate/cardiolipin synthase-like enzyme
MKKSKFIVYVVSIAMMFIAGFLIGNTKDFKMPLCSFSPDDDIVPIVNENYFNVTFNEIQNADSSIDIVLYEFKWYDSNNSVVKIRQALIDAAERGVSVRLILDQSEWYGQITELSKENKRTGDYLASNGIQVKYDSMKQTTHNKMLIIDDEIVILGSHNWGSSAFTKNNEASVMINDKGTAEYYEDYFENLWES